MPENKNKLIIKDIKTRQPPSSEYPPDPKLADFIHAMENSPCGEQIISRMERNIELYRSFSVEKIDALISELEKEIKGITTQDLESIRVFLITDTFPDEERYSSTNNNAIILDSFYDNREYIQELQNMKKQLELKKQLEKNNE